MRIEWPEGSQPPAGGTEGRIPSCLFYTHRHWALSRKGDFFFCRHCSLPLSFIHCKINKSNMSKEVFTLASLQESLRGSVPVGSFWCKCSWHLCGTSWRTKLPKGSGELRFSGGNGQGREALDSRDVHNQPSSYRCPRGKALRKHSVTANADCACCTAQHSVEAACGGNGNYRGLHCTVRDWDWVSFPQKIFI